jgi:predicted nucleotidyltransferase
MRPSLIFDLKRGGVRDTASRFLTINSQVFGSVLRGLDQDGSELDLLVDALGATLFDLGRLQVEPETLPGIRVDVLTLDCLSQKL